MKTKQLLIAFVALLAVSVTAGNDITKGKYTKEKKIKKEFDVSAEALLKISNSYGDLDITSWDQNRTVIEVTVTTSGNDEDKVQDKLDEIDVIFDASREMVSARTTFDNDRNRSWWNSWRNNNVNMKVNYTIKVPVTNSIDLNNDYGAIFLNEIKGRAKISCDYGRLELGNLLSTDNELRFDYSKNSTVSFMAGGKIVADYSGFTIEKAGNIELNADYNSSEFIEVGNLEYTCDYGSLKAESAKHINGRGDYLSLRLGEVSGNVDIVADFGSIRIEELTPLAGNVKIRTDYTGVKIGYHPDYAFTFNINLEYAGLSGKEDLEITKTREERSDKYYEGYYKSKNAPHTIDIDSEYGGVSLIKQ